ncbi:MAG: thioredoxin domain-containing protein [Candidatus Hinthialibacter antarcticus]|nr:thioredoxin domain-containing protein [Candidatus Hinthialibacter antarcticus]
MTQPRFVLLLCTVCAVWSAASCNENKISKEKPMTNASSEPKHTNALINETSPYLLQHAHNPVDWHPWNEQALRLSKEQNKPIFLSIGYSACHWCHVMEHESFENEEIAAYMNEHFICIKVDREERPDLDEIYMSAVQAMTGSGGWPMSVFLTPDLKPFYGGTYFPPTDMYGRPGFLTVLQGVNRAYRDDHAKVLESAEKMTFYIQQAAQQTPGDHPLNEDLLETAFQQMRGRFDSTHGGFGGAPKFPHSMDIALLLRYHHRTSDAESLQMAEFSLRKMAEGGMYDQVGGGFHRYSVDERWLIPHFEKMLYDNALLAKTYTEAYQVTGKSLYKKIVVEIMEYVLREMASPEGGFYSTQDADSEGKEGIFFAWTPEQIAQALGDEKEAKFISQYWGVEPHGNFEEGTSVLHVNEEFSKTAEQFGLTDDEAKAIIQKAKSKLFGAREARVHPGRDEKILTDWNGLMISAMAFAGNVLQEKRYVDAADKACDFLFAKVYQDNRLLHVYKDGRTHTNGFLSDYSYLINGLIDVYEATRNPKRLAQAIELMKVMDEQFWDAEHGAYFFTGNDHEALIARTKDPMDNAVPSGNSMAVLSLIRLGAMTGDATLREKAQTSLQVFVDGIRQYPSAYSQMMSGLDLLISQPQEVVLAAGSSEELDAFQRALFSRFLPNKVVLYSYPQTQDALKALSPMTEGKGPLGGAPAAYVCRDFTCELPVKDAESLVQQLLED